MLFLSFFLYACIYISFGPPEGKKIKVEFGPTPASREYRIVGLENKPQLEQQVTKYIDSLITRMTDNRFYFNNAVFEFFYGETNIVGIHAYNIYETENGFIYKHNGAKINLARIENENIADIKTVIFKELYASYKFATWYFENSSYVGHREADLASLNDGMQHAYTNYELGDVLLKYNSLIDPNFKWDGVSAITCEQLQTVEFMYQNQMVMGEGVQNLIDRQCK